MYLMSLTFGLLLVSATAIAAPRMQAVTDPATGQIALTEKGKLLLRYNYQPIEPGEVLSKVTAGNRKYAVARSDYIHPLYGFNGEVLTRDWPLDHPHHRGIYWAWPEVDFGAKRGDLHALQNVFARPTGRISLKSGARFAEIQAENRWLGEDRNALVREVALIRAYPASATGRVIDLAFQFTAETEDVTIARRGTEHYGGLNLRLATPKGQEIFTFTSPANAVPRLAWSDLSGIFAEGGERSGLSVLQHPDNPDYPGDWIQYPELSWCQPAFPRAGTRYALLPGKPLVLSYRLWVHAGAKPDAATAAQLVDDFKSAAAPVFMPAAAPK